MDGILFSQKNRLVPAASMLPEQGGFFFSVSMRKAYNFPAKA